jgi:hypothetical protein
LSKPEVSIVFSGAVRKFNVWINLPEISNNSIFVAGLDSAFFMVKDTLAGFGNNEKLSELKLELLSEESMIL